MKEHLEHRGYRIATAYPQEHTPGYQNIGMENDTYGSGSGSEGGCAGTPETEQGLGTELNSAKTKKRIFSISAQFIIANPV